MKVGFDSVLLGAWANGEGARRALDIGAGTGILSLMLAQRFPLLSIDSLEIDDGAAAQAESNAKASPWKERLRIIHEDVKLFSSSARYDLIICNPPFFHKEKGAVSSEARRAAARQTGCLSHEELILKVSQLLSEEGIFSLILPTREGEDFLRVAEGAGLFCLRQTVVKPLPGKEPRRLLLELGKKRGCLITDSLVLEISHHQYSPAFKKLTLEFYL